MGERTGIGWTSATWNPWMGCEKVSEGCDNCYMFRDMRRYGRDPEKVVRSKTKFDMPLKLKEPSLIFTCSWSDWFHADADPWRDEAWDIIRRTPQHTYQVLTKRHGRIARHLPADWGEGYPNVWLGVTVESGNWMRRADALAQVPARTRFLSCEPLVAPIYPDPLRTLLGSGRIHWVIAGGESGANAGEVRPMDLRWARDIRDVCQQHKVAFFLKQLGGFPDPRAHEKAVLDGRTWTEFPVAAHVALETPVLSTLLSERVEDLR